MLLFGCKGPSGFSARSTAEEVTRGINASGLTAIVTGASSGIGAETARVLALRGAHVVMAVRNTEAGRQVKESIRKECPSAKIDVTELDLSSMASVRKFASDYISTGLPLNILINNAGLWGNPSALSRDGIELQFATNYLGPFLLTNLLLETMKTTSKQSNREGRIVNLSSMAHQYVSLGDIDFDMINKETDTEFKAGLAYARSKLATVLHANELTRRLKAEGVPITANSVHPGIVATNVMRHHGIANAFFTRILKMVIKSVQQGAATTCYVALHPQVDGVSGEYFADNNVAKASDLALDVDLAKKLWDFSTRLTGAK